MDQMTDEPKVDVEAEVQALGEVGIAKVDLTKAPRRIGEVMEEIAPQGEKVKKQDLENQEIIIRSLRFFNGRYGLGCFVLGTYADGTLFNTILGNKVIMPKLALIQDQLPIAATLVKKEGGQGTFYWDLE
jgi:hypothetical protein